MNSFIHDTFDRVATEGSKLVRFNKRRTLSSREVQSAVKLILPGELSRHAVSEGTKAVTKYIQQWSMHISSLCTQFSVFFILCSILLNFAIYFSGKLNLIVTLDIQFKFFWQIENNHIKKAHHLFMFFWDALSLASLLWIYSILSFWTWASSKCPSRSCCKSYLFLKSDSRGFF